MIRRQVGWLVAAFVFAVDQLSKWFVTGPLALPQRDSYEILPIFRLLWVSNHGVSMGKLVASSDAQRWTLTLFTAGIAVFVGVWMTREIGRANDWKLYHNGSVFRTGSLSSGDAYNRACPFRFENGTSPGAPGPFNMTVAVGD